MELLKKIKKIFALFWERLTHSLLNLYIKLTVNLCILHAIIISLSKYPLLTLYFLY